MRQICLSFVRRSVALVPLTMLLAFVACGMVSAHHDEMSRHFIAESLPVTDVVVASSTTEGPYFEAESDYTTGPNMVAAGRAGAAGVTSDRVSVVNGIPLALTLNLYQVDSGATTATEFANADVFLWHCDAKGVYSAVPIADQRTEGTVGQKWLRGVQTTPSNGSVTFNTILPGWYTGRTVHFHVRVRQAGTTSFAITTQLFLSEAFVAAFKTISPYTLDTQTLTVLSADSIYTGVAATVRDKLVLNPTGSATSGYAATFNLGIQVTGSVATSTATTTVGVPPTPTSTSTASTTSAVVSATKSASAANGVSVLSIGFVAMIVVAAFHA